ncbi:MAG: serine hydrolase [Bacteroidota bacterium]
MDRIMLIFCLALAMTACQTPSPLEQLERDVNQLFASQEGSFAMAFKMLEGSDSLLINPHEKFHAASTMKTPVMIEMYKQAATGKFALTDSLEVVNEFSSIVDGSPFQLTLTDDSEPKLYSKIGQKLPWSELAYDMIIASSNLATNILIDQLDAKVVTQTMRELGAPDIDVLRGVEDIKAFEQGLSNRTTAFDLLRIFEHLAQGTAVSPEASREMIDILLDQQFNDVIPAYLPEQVKVAHKTGWITGVHHDSGLVMLPDGRRYVLILLSKEMTDMEAGTEMLARVSEKVYGYVMGE